MLGIYQDHGIRFSYPASWEVEVNDDGPRTTVTLSDPGGTAFALVTLDEDSPPAGEMAEQALQAMREEYPELDAYPATETIAGHEAVGHDVEFFSFDFLNACAIRCFQTPRQSVLMLGQWSETADGDAYEPTFRAMRRSFEETDEDDA
jgi:hypothetical protein